MLKSTMKSSSPEKFLDALEIAAASCSKLNMSRENETSCPRIIFLLTSICTSFDFSSQAGCILSGGIQALQLTLFC